jgi:hypothetical protein
MNNRSLKSGKAKVAKLRRVITEGLGALADKLVVVFTSTKEAHAEATAKGLFSWLEEKDYSPGSPQRARSAPNLADRSEGSEPSGKSKRSKKQPGLSREQLHRIFLDAKKRELEDHFQRDLEAKRRAARLNGRTY